MPTLPPPPIPAPPSAELLPPPGELRTRLAVALREVSLLRRILKLAEHAARLRQEGGTK